MRIIVDPSSFDCLNMGDVAMLQVAVARLRRQWPESVIQVFTNDPVALSLHCPDTEPLPHSGRTFWFSDQEILGRLHEHIPANASRALIAMKRRLRRRSPGFLRNILRWKLHLTRADATAWERFLTAMDHADLYVVSGAATLNDKSKAHAHVVLGTIEMALSHGIPVAMFSQGVGPLSDPELLTEARRVLPRVTFVALRENLYGPTLVRTLGGRPDRVEVTGDDSVELAYESRAIKTGAGIGVNLRVARSSDIEPELIDTMRAVLHSAAEKYHARLVPIPIALHAAADDPKVIRQLLEASDVQSDRAWSCENPREVIRAAGNCRIVVTGAYHAAVFALAQGIPAVCVAGNSNYMEKFAGLLDQFRAGSELVSVHDSNFKDAIGDAIERAWISADTQRPGLLAAARRQIEVNRAAYQHMAAVLDYTSLRHRAA
jgi:colanic acid/amylovoran biosynthesis protein